MIDRMLIGVSRPHPDGLDPVLDAYRVLTELLDKAEPVGPCDPQPCKYTEGEPEGMPCPCENLVQLPGTGDIIDTNDANVVNQLERFLVERIMTGPIDPQD